MNILFIHQNMPAQFKHLAPALARDRRNKVVFLTRRTDVAPPGVIRASYKPPRSVRKDTHPYLRLHEEAVLHGQQVARSLVQMKRQGFVPDIVIGHPGWGELLFVKDILPSVPLISYAEFFYRGVGADVGFDPEDGHDVDAICRARMRASHLLTSIEACTRAISPTHWQKSVHPHAFHEKIDVVFDGIDTTLATPEGEASLRLPDGTAVRRGNEIVTYVARNLEPYRGFRTFMRALPELLSRRPNARVVIVGGDEVSYGSKPKGHANWREAMLAEVEFDTTRVHFTGRIAYADFLKLMRASAAHVYLTYPFVLSWSCLEAMACGALIIGSDTAPVREVIRHDENGLLTDFFDSIALAGKIADVLADPRAFDRLRVVARETVVDRYALDRSLLQQINILDRVTDGRLTRQSTTA